ncbi:MAG: DUF4129 domain-containing protein [Phycisphaerales bacterium]|nr:DUF4129 domain-containing protein [Phycisphaerales bacterium]
MVAGVAARILADEGVEPDPSRRPIADDSRAVNAFRQFFWTHYSYSLSSPPPPPGQDPIDWFLTESREGHCEYYAAALAALCRSVGIPARVVTGYVAAEYNPTTNHYVVRERNAHAWVEAQPEPGIWKTYDATPPADLLHQHGPAPGVLTKAAQVLDAINYAWINSVVSFDTSSREDLLRWSDPATSAITKRVEDLLQRVRSVPLAFGVPLGIRIGIVASIAGFIVLLLGRSIARWRRVRSRRPAAILRRLADRGARARLLQTPLYQEMLTLLERVGARKPAWQPPMSWVRELRERGSESVPDLRRLTDLFYVMRFGGRDLTEDEKTEAGAILRELAAWAETFREGQRRDGGPRFSDLSR